jgi:hypothetical protein
MTDNEVQQLIKRFMAILRDMHVELRAQQRALLDQGVTPASVQQQIRNAKKSFPTDKTQIRQNYDQLLRAFENQASSSVRNAARILLPKVRQEIKKNV